MQPMFSLDKVQKIYENRIILDLDHLDIQQGEILSIVGPSGAGKSTLLRLLNFLEYVDGGTIQYRQEIISPTIPISVRRSVTMLFQHPALLNTNVDVNIHYGLSLRNESDHRELIEEIMKRLGLINLRKSNARKLSSGEAQRVALARALVINPDVLLLDEPTANLDPYNIGLIEEVIREINREKNTTIVLVTHNVFQAKRIAQRSALLLNGKLVEINSTENFFNDPHDQRTRDFVDGIMIY